jgi:hypothetical protein
MEVRMPFRGVAAELYPGKPERILTAGPGDVHIWLGVGTFGAMGVSGGPNYYVGGPGIAGELGTLVSGNEWDSDLEPGDEVWVMAAEELSFAASIRITGTVRSTAKPKRAARHATESQEQG